MSVVNVRKFELKKRDIRDFKEWSKRKNSVYIGRDMQFYVEGTKGSKWANPFSSRKYGLNKCLKLYKAYLLNNSELLKQLHELKGKELGCWCKPNKCHGDILLELINDRLS
jgi:hypothetical protein